MTANNYFKELNTQVMLNSETIAEAVVIGDDARPSLDQS